MPPLAPTAPLPPRSWRITVRTGDSGLQLHCSTCGPVSLPADAGGRRATLAHFADHARTAFVDHYLRTCCCGAEGCRSHPRHRGCDGPIVLALSRRGRTWRLADVCHACAMNTPHCVEVSGIDAAPLGAMTSPVAPQPWDAEPVWLWDAPDSC